MNALSNFDPFEAPDVPVPDANGCFSTPAEGAKFMASKGLPQVPLSGPKDAGFNNPGKNPAINGVVWQDKASTDFGQIDAWAAQFPGCNFGSVARRELNGNYVLEIDSPNVRETYQKETGCDFTASLIIESGPGREHRWYRFDEMSLDLQNIGQTDAAGFSLRVHNEQCVSPGSIHSVRGTQYRVAPNSSTPRVASPQEIAWFKSKKNQVRETKNLQEDGQPISEGSRNVTLTSIAGKLRQMGFSQEIIQSNLLVFNETRCDPPLDEEEVERIAHSISRYPIGSDVPVVLHGGLPSGSQPDISIGPIFGQTDKIITNPDEAKNLATSLGIRENFNNLLSGDFKDGRKPWIFQNIQKPREVPTKPTEWILDQMIMLGGLHVFSSLPGGQKSILSLLLSKTVAYGESLFGRKNSGRPRYVVILDRENPPSVVYERLYGLGLLNLDNVFVWGEWDEKAGSCPETFDDPRLIECARIMGDDVLFVADSLSAFSEGVDENSVQEMNPIVRKALRLARMSAGVILLHHTDKGGNFGRGTVAIRANADMAFLMEKNGEIVTISPERFRPCPEWTLKFKMDWGGLTGIFTPHLVSDSLVAGTLSQTAEQAIEEAERRNRQEQEETTRNHYIRVAKETIEKAYNASLEGTGRPISNRNQLATLIGLDPASKRARTLLNGSESNPWECLQGDRGAIIYLPKGIKEIPPIGGNKRADAETMFTEGKTIKEVSEALTLPDGTVRSWRTKWGREHESNTVKSASFGTK